MIPNPDVMEVISVSVKLLCSFMNDNGHPEFYLKWRDFV